MLLDANSLIISEFMASNGETLRDGDGNSSDWVEIYNASETAVDLAGYRLTDSRRDLSKWVFPNRVLDANSYLVVFASGQDAADYIDNEGNLHTDYRLSADGEYLALVSPDGAVVHGGRFSGGIVESFGDHRVAMSFAVAATIADDDVLVRDVDAVDTSFPEFAACMASIGANIQVQAGRQE